jgi:hypothetical protein
MSLDLSTVKHHPALDEIVDVICTNRRTRDRSFFQAEVAYFLGKIASSMRATVVTKTTGEIPVNVYSLALAPSGYGKGYSVTFMEDELLKRFKERFEQDTFPLISEQNLAVIANLRAARKGSDQQEEFVKTQREFDKPGPYILTFDSGTIAGVKEMRQKLLLGGIGSINLQVDEIGSNLTGSSDMLTLFLELYDNGKVKQKLTKNTAENPRVQEIDGKTPANMLLFGTPTKVFDGGPTENLFYSFLDTGYARRCIFGYGRIIPGEKKLTAEEIYDQLTTPGLTAITTKWATKFYQLADPALYGWKMEVPKDVAVALYDYQLDCEAQALAMAAHEEIQKAELSHRHSKALKLAGAYAFIDGSTEVEMTHLLSAIKLVEESGQSFLTTLTRDSTYVKLAKYIAQVRNEVTHADLHEALPFYRGNKGTRDDMMTLATGWGYKNHIIIKKSFIDGIEFFKGETLNETDLEKIVISYSDNWAYDFLANKVPFKQLHKLTQAPNLHWTNHHFKDGHRERDNVIPGFNLVVLDVDSGTSLQSACELMQDYKFLVYTTKRHQTEGHGDRFRMILPTNYSLELDPEEYKEFMQGVFAWLPFKTDESYAQPEKKSETFDGGTFLYNLDGSLLDVLPFIPKTSRNEQHKLQSQELGSLDNLERWFAQRMVPNQNRNNLMIKYALCLVDAGWSFQNVRDQVVAFDSKLSSPLGVDELNRSILVTVAKRYQP